jgi:MoaA/NifB/PqqE/SkfB family radical SAM enzyme
VKKRSNALLIDRGWAEALVGNGAVDLTISIDSVQKDTYEKLRRGARFEKLLESLDMLNETRTGTSSMKLTLRCAIMKSNYREIGAFIEFAREHRFDIVQIAPLTGDGDPENIFANKDREALEYLRTMRLAVRAQADEYGIKLLDWLPCEDDDAQKPSGVPADRRVPASCPEPEGDVAARSLCFRPWRQLAVNVRGEVFPECLCTRPVGTVFENSFIEIWNNEKMQRYRKNMINGDYAFCNSACSSGAVPPEHLKFIVG